jgi:lipoprotein-anchoring transpeptidase ErfK/SrfK
VRSPLTRPAAVALAAALAGVLALGACGGDDGPAAAAPRPSGSAAAPEGTPSGAKPSPGRSRDAAGEGGRGALTGAASGAKVQVSDVSLVARASTASVRVYPSAAATTPSRTFASPLASGAPLVFLVQERSGDRLRVLLPARPNGSQGWVDVADVTLAQTDYRVSVSTGKHELAVFRKGKVALRVPVGLGTGTTPTPGGVFYVKELLKPRDTSGPYGPYAYGLSGYSEVLDEFLGGDGQIGIHGTNDPAGVGRDVSHGCIRMRNADITRLVRMLPLGTPVQIVR